MRRHMRASVALVLFTAACTSGTVDGASTEPSTTTQRVESPTTSETAEPMGHTPGTVADASDVVAAALATAPFQDVRMAEAAGYASTIDDLGCFENTASGGMGLHYLNGQLMDETVDLAAPEALVYELDASGEVAGLVAHEYIVPLEAWADRAAPTLFGRAFHLHPVLPLWVLHAWIWKDNPSGMFEDWNPKVRMCPDEVPVFGVDVHSERPRVGGV